MRCGIEKRYACGPSAAVAASNSTFRPSNIALFLSHFRFGCRPIEMYKEKKSEANAKDVCHLDASVLR